MKYILALLLSAATLVAGEAQVVRNFDAKEVNIDTFGVMNHPDITGAPAWGAGIGAAYFVTRGLGFGARAISYSDFGGVFVDEVEARILFRAPLWDRVAPYGFVSGGYSFDGKCAGAGAGGGIEYRLNRRLAVFGETGLRVWPSCETTSYTTTQGECGPVTTASSSDSAHCDWLTSFGIRFVF